MLKALNCRKRHFSVPLCDLRVSVVKLLEKTLTTEAQRSHRGTETDRCFLSYALNP